MSDEPLEIHFPWGQIAIALSILLAAGALIGVVYAILEKNEAVPLSMIALDSLKLILDWKRDSMGVMAP